MGLGDRMKMTKCLLKPFVKGSGQRIGDQGFIFTSLMMCFTGISSPVAGMYLARVTEILRASMRGSIAHVQRIATIPREAFVDYR